MGKAARCRRAHDVARRFPEQNVPAANGPETIVSNTVKSRARKIRRKK